MQIFPAIDLSGGQVVRLYQGDYDKMTVYGADPCAVAREFMAAGAGYLHVVDLREDLEDQALKVPHMGWNSLQIRRDDPIFKYVKDGEYVYYVHSFYGRNCAESTLATSQYGNVAVTGVVKSGKVYGTQFHPEKSGETGLRLLKAFAEL